jgi:hypothetical protein
VAVPFDIVASLADVPANRAVLSILQGRATARPLDDPWALDGFELHVHPDLQERLDQLAVGHPGGRSVGLYGVPGLVAGGVIYAVARGTSRIEFRIPSGPAREAILLHGGDAESAFGPDWVVADAWLSDIPSAAGTALLRSWVAVAASTAMLDA